MNKIQKLLFLVFLISYLASRISLLALFSNDQFFSARPLSLGGAYVAVADDSSAVNTNPAGLSSLPSTELSLTFSQPYGIPALTESYAAFAIPWKLNAFGSSYRRLSLASALTEESFTFSYARMLRQAISIGFNLKLLRLTLGEFSGGGVSSLANASEISTDLGFFAKPWEQFALGFVFYDLNAPTMRLLANSSGQKINTNARLGISYQPKDFVLFTGEIQTEKGALKNLGENYHFGTELLFAESIAFRMGVDRNKFTGGAGIRHRGLKIDFAFFHQGDLGLLYKASVAFQWR